MSYIQPPTLTIQNYLKQSKNSETTAFQETISKTNNKIFVTSSSNSKKRYELNTYELSKEKNLEFSNHLDKLILDCSLSDWDGYGAFPIGKSSANQLKKFLNYINDFGLLRDISIDNICPNTHGTLTISIDYKNENFINIEFGESFFTLTAKIETSILAWENINYNANTFSTIKDIIHTNFNG